MPSPITHVFPPSLEYSYLIIGENETASAITVIVLDVLLAVISTLGALLSILTLVVISSEILPALSIHLNLIFSSRLAVKVIVPTPLEVVKFLVVQAPFSYHSYLSIPLPSSCAVTVTLTFVLVHSPLEELVIFKLSGAVWSVAFANKVTLPLKE